MRLDITRIYFSTKRVLYVLYFRKLIIVKKKNFCKQYTIKNGAKIVGLYVSLLAFTYHNEC